MSQFSSCFQEQVKHASGSLETARTFCQWCRERNINSKQFGHIWWSKLHFWNNVTCKHDIVVMICVEVGCLHIFIACCCVSDGSGKHWSEESLGSAQCCASACRIFTGWKKVQSLDSSARSLDRSSSEGQQQQHHVPRSRCVSIGEQKGALFLWST